jgi:hypothetical protein
MNYFFGFVSLRAQISPYEPLMHARYSSQAGMELNGEHGQRLQ